MKITKEEWLAEYERIEEDSDDVLYRKAVDYVVANNFASIKMLGEGLGVSDNKAKRLLTEMQVDGILGPHRRGQPRKVLLRKK